MRSHWNTNRAAGCRKTRFRSTSPRTLSPASLAADSTRLVGGGLGFAMKESVHISLGHLRTFISWESEAESDLAPPELGFSFFLFCFFFFFLAPRSPPGLLDGHGHKDTSLNGGGGDGRGTGATLLGWLTDTAQPKWPLANASYHSNEWQLADRWLTNGSSELSPRRPLSRWLRGGMCVLRADAPLHINATFKSSRPAAKGWRWRPWLC